MKTINGPPTDHICGRELKILQQITAAKQKFKFTGVEDILLMPAMNHL